MRREAKGNNPHQQSNTPHVRPVLDLKDEADEEDEQDDGELKPGVSSEHEAREGNHELA